LNSLEFNFSAWRRGATTPRGALHAKSPSGLPMAPDTARHSNRI